MATQKDTLLKAVDAALAVHRDIHTLTDVANRTAISYHRLRGWLDRNRAPEEFLKVATLLNLGGTWEELEKKYDFKPTHARRARSATIADRYDTADEALDVLDNVLHGTNKPADIQAALKAVFRSLNHGDLMVLATVDQNLYESDPEGRRVLGPALAEAINGSAHLIYVRPSMVTIKAIEKNSTKQDVWDTDITNQHRALIGELEDGQVARMWEKDKIKTFCHLIRWPPDSKRLRSPLPAMPGLVVATFYTSTDQRWRVYVRVASLHDDGQVMTRVKSTVLANQLENFIREVSLHSAYWKDLANVRDILGIKAPRCSK